ASVALVERHKKPFFPAHCGEAMPNTWTEFIDLDSIGCPKNEIKRIILNVSSPKEYSLKLKKYKALIFDRNFVENYLLKEAKKKGVELKLGIRMSSFKPPNDVILSNKKNIKGKIIIDASGISCQVGKHIGLDTKLLNKQIGVCIQSRVQGDFDNETLKIWFHKPYAPFGYAWFFPVDDKTANIGIGIPGGQKVDLSNLLKNYIKDVTGGNFKVTHNFRACVPLAPPMSRLYKDNVMFVGDAARLVNSEWGCGIGTALFSGSSAGTTAAKFIQGELSSLEPYQESMKSRLKILERGYKHRVKYENESKYVNTYRRNYSIISSLNKVVPSFLQNYISKIILNRIG
ncbi:MAG: NAD(P)/FAD-dependent oxidoreductase, partial [Thermoplasmatales archaeon]|nr:NAD(P)/FAD-dependent oxidoreductase [Thermoplasmatales archaeon]